MPKRCLSASFGSIVMLSCALQILAPVVARWPPQNTSFVTPTCTPTFASHDGPSLALAITIVSWKHDERQLSSVHAHHRLPVPLQEEFHTLDKCSAEVEIHRLLHFSSFDIRNTTRPRRTIGFSFEAVRSALRRDAAQTSHCIISLHSATMERMTNIDIGVARDILMASGAGSVRAAVVTHNKILKPIVNPGRAEAWNLASALIAKFTAAEVLAYPCGNVLLEIHSGEQRMCGKLDLDYLGSWEGRRRAHRVNQTNSSTFYPFFEWIFSFLKVSACLNSWSEVLENTCYWLHNVHRNSEIAAEEWVYMSANFPLEWDSEFEYIFRRSELVTSGWDLHPGVHFLTPAAITPPLSAAEALTESNAPIAFIGPLGLEGTGHHLISSVLVASNASTRLRQGYNMLKFADTGLKDYSKPQFPYEEAASAAKCKLCAAAGMTYPVPSVTPDRICEQPSPDPVDPLLTMYCPGETGSFPMMVRAPLVRIPAWKARFFPSVVHLSQLGEGVNDAWHSKHLKIPNCRGQGVSTVGLSWSN